MNAPISQSPVRWRYGLLSIMLVTALAVVCWLPALAQARNPNHTGTDWFGVVRGGVLMTFIPSNGGNVGAFASSPNHSALNMPGHSAAGDMNSTGLDQFVWFQDEVGLESASLAVAPLLPGSNNLVANYSISGVNLGLCSQSYVLVGDWDGNGRDSGGIYCGGRWYLRNSNSTGNSNYVADFGGGTDQPVVGDWNNDGKDTIGIYRNGNVYLRNYNSTGASNIVYNFGTAGMLAFAGDWNNDGTSTLGVYMQHGVMALRNSNTTGGGEVEIQYGNGWGYGSNPYGTGYRSDSDFPFAHDVDGQ